MKKLLIVGAGFAGLRLARSLADKNFEVWLFDKNNYHQFQPLFYQVATSGLEPSSIAFPLRKVFQNKKHVHVRCAEVISVDTVSNILHTSIGEFAFDYLVIATGADTNFFGNEQIRTHALPMKSVSEALHIRNTILQNFEDALSCTPEQKAAHLNIVVVGAGPTGVEVSGALAEMRSKILPKDYPEIDFSRMHIYLVEAGGKTLGNMSGEASEKSNTYLKQLGVEVLTSVNVVAYDGHTVGLSTGQQLPSRTLIWAAGIEGNTILGLPESTLVRGNRFEVDDFCRIKGTAAVFAIGDIASMKTGDYPNGHPQVATVANDMASHLSKNLLRLQQGQEMLPFLYKNKGSMATVGRHLAVVDLPGLRFQGFFAWLFWMFLHLMLILGIKNKLLVFVNWMWKYFTFDQSLRLIIKPSKK